MAWINPNIPEGYSFIKDTLKFYVYQHGDILSRATDNFYYDYTSGANKADVIGDIRNYSFSSSGNSNMATVHGENQFTVKGRILSWFPIMTIRVNTTTNPITVSYSNDSEKTAFTTYPYFNWWYQINNAEKIIITNDTNWAESKATEFSTLLSALQYIYNWYANVNIYVDDELWIKAGLDPTYTSNGGGATHIAKVTGQLKDLSASNILLVSGGGGGGLLFGETPYAGADAGGISGSGSNSGNQSSGYAFGQGESGTNVSGGGGGYYGGEKGGSLLSGGAGSGYIGNALVSNKKMVGYNVPTSSSESTKTESVNVYSVTKETNKPKAGNGFARIKFLRNN